MNGQAKTGRAETVFGAPQTYHFWITTEDKNNGPESELLFSGWPAWQPAAVVGSFGEPHRARVFFTTDGDLVGTFDESIVYDEAGHTVAAPLVPPIGERQDFPSGEAVTWAVRRPTLRDLAVWFCDIGTGRFNERVFEDALREARTWLDLAGVDMTSSP